MSFSFSKHYFPFARFPALRLVLLYIAGILVTHLFGPVPRILFVILISGLLLILSESILYRRKVLWSSRLSTLSFILLVIASGSARMEQINTTRLSPAEQFISLCSWDSVYVMGEVKELSYNREGQTRLDLRADAVLINNKTGISKPFVMRVLWELKAQPTLGDKVTFSGIIIPISEPRNPLGFNYADYLKEKDIYTQVRAEQLIDVTANEKVFSWLHLRRKALLKTEQLFGPSTEALAKALLLGYKKELEADVRQAYARAGLSHIMAVSGLHVGFILAPFWGLVIILSSTKYGRYIGLGMLALILWFYAGLTGFPASVIRASVTALFLAYGKLFSKRSDSINLTAAAALIILLADPEQLFEIGFQLSFAAVFMILMTLPVVQHKLPYQIRFRWYGIPVMVMIISVIVQLGLYPLQVWYFGEVSTVSPLANALLVPLLGLVVPVSMMALLLSSVSIEVAELLAYPADWFLGVMNTVVHYLAGREWAWTEAEPGSPLFFIFWMLVILAISAWRKPQIRWKLISLSLMSLILLQGQRLIDSLQTAKMEIIVFDVGQGDSILLKTPLGKHILIDTGTWSPGRNSGEEVILPYLRYAGINYLDAVILTHPHADHIGGTETIIKEVSVGRIFNSGFEYDSELYRSYLREAKSLEVPIYLLQAGDSLGLDPSVLMLVLGPERSSSGSDPNQHSVVLQLIYGETRFLLTGDAGEEQEERLVRNYGDLMRSDWLKVGHHGSRTSSGDLFLGEVWPQVSVVSVASDNRFGHPHQEALHRLQNHGSLTLFTAQERAMIFQSDGELVHRVEWQK